MLFVCGCYILALPKCPQSDKNASRKAVIMFVNTIFLATLLVCSTVVQSTNTFWINKIPAYAQLDNCAVQPLSTIVRDQSYGCGFSTSYSCFCTASSAHFNSVISELVAESCPGTAADITSAQNVFHSYCQLNGTTVVNRATALLASRKL